MLCFPPTSHLPQLPLPPGILSYPILSCPAVVSCLGAGPFDDEVAKSFYLDFPLLRESMPAAAFDDKSAKQSTAAAAPVPDPGERLDEVSHVVA